MLASTPSARCVKFQILHRTRYEYQVPVRESFNETRLKPVTNEHQRCESFLLRVLPAVRLRHYQDFYCNWVSHFEITEPHGSLLIEAQAVVTTMPVTVPGLEERTSPLAELDACRRMERCFDYLQPSGFVSWDAEVWHLARDIIAEQDDVWQAALAILRWVHTNFQYVPNATNAMTHMNEALKHRHGVCQDFSQVMIGLCRAVKIPALYVSGYLQTHGVAASHAWVEVFIPGRGWQGLDPTHGGPVDMNYVKVAVGRDYGDVPPTRGHYKGTQERSIEVRVEITSLQEG